MPRKNVHLGAIKWKNLDKCLHSSSVCVEVCPVWLTTGQKQPRAVVEIRKEKRKKFVQSGSRERETEWVGQETLLYCRNNSSLTTDRQIHTHTHTHTHRERERGQGGHLKTQINNRSGLLRKALQPKPLSLLTPQALPWANPKGPSRAMHSSETSVEQGWIQKRIAITV